MDSAIRVGAAVVYVTREGPAGQMERDALVTKIHPGDAVDLTFFDEAGNQHIVQEILPLHAAMAKLAKEPESVNAFWAHKLPLLPPAPGELRGVQHNDPVMEFMQKLLPTVQEAIASLADKSEGATIPRGFNHDVVSLSKAFALLEDLNKMVDNDVAMTPVAGKLRDQLVETLNGLADDGILALEKAEAAGH